MCWSRIYVENSVAYRYRAVLGDSNDLVQVLCHFQAFVYFTLVIILAPSANLMNSNSGSLYVMCFSGRIKRMGGQVWGGCLIFLSATMREIPRDPVSYVFGEG